MKSFASLCCLLSLSGLLVPLAPACSNSNSAPAGDGGLPPATDSGAEAGGDGAASCAPVAPASGSVPTFTAPALGQGVCNATNISAFVAACGSSTGSTAKCATYAQSVASSACGQCLFSKNSTIAPVETVTVGGQGVLVPSVGGCILGANGSGAADCATAADAFGYCATVACAACAATEAACAKAAETTACAKEYSGAGACASFIMSALNCLQTASTDANVEAAAYAICGSGEGGSSDGGNEAGATDGGATDSSTTDSSTNDSSTTDSGESDATSDGGETDATDGAVTDGAAMDGTDQ